MNKIIRIMLVFVPLAFVAEFALHNPILIFATSAIALVPLAGLLGEATEELAIHTGPRIGGLLNATLGNAAELIITIVALQHGKYELIKASLTGSIIGNLLLILGFSLLLGGLRHGVQRFDPKLTGMSASMMFLAVIGLMIPTLFELVKEAGTGRVQPMHTEVFDKQLIIISLGVAGVLILMYVLSLVYQFRTPGATLGSHTGFEEAEEIMTHKASWSIKTSVAVLAVSTLAIVFMSEFLVGVVEPVAQSLGIRELFLGVILIPIVGNVAEHLVGVQAAMKNQMELSLNISLGSSMQIALFVAPLLVFLSLFIGPAATGAGFFGRPQLTLFFSLFEVITLGLSVIIAAFISLDGESNWLEGAMLLAVYIIAALGFFYL
ncbi:MAG: calcium/proton exchanger [Pyrinomonadaceae bacterium]|nr:calcium/proton exchanger [Pyrinomonadaceae bacterium]